MALKRPLTLVDKFDRRLTGRLVKLIKQRPPIYDDSYDEHRDTEYRNGVWKDIARELMNKCDYETVEMLKQKWKSTKDSFTKSYKLYVIRKHKGLKAKTPQQYKFMSFLIPHINPRQIMIALNTTELPPLPGLDMKDSDMDADSSPSDIANESADEEKSPEITIKTDPLNTEYQESLDQSESQHLFQQIYASTSNCVESDEIDIFFQSLAKTVKRLKPLNQAMIKKTIANVILDAEIKEAKEAEDNEKNNTDENYQ